MTYPPIEPTPTTSFQPAAAFTPQPPVSGPGGPGYPAYLQPSPPRRVSPATLALAIVCVLLVAATAVGFGLYFDKRSDLSRTKTDLTSQVRTQQGIVADQNTKLQQAAQTQADLTTQLASSKASLTDVTKQRDALVPCMRRIQDAFDAARAGDSKRTDTALDQAIAACDKAENAMDN